VSGHEEPLPSGKCGVGSTVAARGSQEEALTLYKVIEVAVKRSMSSQKRKCRLTHRTVAGTAVE
jgi:hypothetical protein